MVVKIMAMQLAVNHDLDIVNSNSLASNEWSGTERLQYGVAHGGSALNLRYLLQCLLPVTEPISVSSIQISPASKSSTIINSFNERPIRMRHVM